MRRLLAATLLLYALSIPAGPITAEEAILPATEEQMDAAEEDATVPLDDKYITGDAESAGAPAPQLPLEPGGGDGVLEALNMPPRAVTDLPGLDNAAVEKFRTYYLAPERVKWLSRVLEDGEQYRLYVRERLKEREMPAYLEYLPVVESSYKINAKSRAGALGLWQFMANSTRGFLKRDDFVDERLDPWRSTDAALAKLCVNYNQFGDWLIALAAYNCGAGAMQGIMRRNPNADYWTLAAKGALRKETAQYVPRLIAIADVCENTAHFGCGIPTARDEDGNSINPRAGSFDYAATNGAFSLRRLASALKIDEEMLLSMNTALFRDITPPHIAYTVRVPEGMGEAASYALSTIAPYHFMTRYTVVAGDNLWKIAKAFHVTVSALCDANGISEKATLKIGKNLYIPNR